MALSSLLGGATSAASSGAGLFSSGASILGGLGSIGGGLFGGGGDEMSEAEKLQQQAAESRYSFMNDALQRYNSMYNNYYWPIEEFTAQNYLENIQAADPYQDRMRDYQLDRGDQLIDLANSTNGALDQNKTNLINTLTQSSDALSDKYRSQASNDVAASYAQQRSALQNQMSQYGVNPNSGAWATQMSGLNNNEALANAGARTAATWKAEDTALNRNAQALNYYTNPTMQYSPGTISPSFNINTLLGGSGGTGSYGQQQQQSAGNSMWGSMGSGLGLLGSGLDSLTSLLGSSNSGSWANNVDLSGVTGWVQ